MKKYEFVANALSKDIEAHFYPDGTLLPTEEQLTRLYDVSRQTVRKSLSILEENGLIEKKQGCGSVVTMKNPAADSGKVAVIATYIDDYIFPVQLGGAVEVLAKKHFSAVLSATGNRICTERKILEDIIREPVAGILVEGTKTAFPNPNIDLYKKISDMKIPIVFFNSCYKELDGALCISADNRRGGYDLTSYLLAKGHKSIAAVFKADDIQGHQRYSGYISAMFDHNIYISDSKTIWYTTETKERIFEGSDLLSFIGDATAVVCYNDEIAFNLIKYLTACGKSVPRDIAVVSFDNSSLSEISPVKITSLSCGVNLGETAAKKLMDILSGRAAVSEVIPWRLEEKESS